MLINTKSVYIVCICVLSLCFFTPALAWEDGLDLVSTTQTTQESVSTESEELEGIEIIVPTEVPSAFGLWLRGVKERVKIVTTLDPIKKDELRLKYAEERMKLAELIAGKSDKLEVQAKAQKMIERSQELMNRVEEHKDKFLENPDERVQRLLKNIGLHQIHREQMMDTVEEKLQDKLSEEQIQRLRELRERGLKDGERLLNAINNEKLPEKVRVHLQQVKERVEAHSQTVQQFQEQKKDILDAVKNGDEQAKEKLQQLWEERKSSLQEIRENAKEQIKSNT